MNKGITSDSSKPAQSSGLNLIRVFLPTIAVYIILIIGFYFLAGDQLLFRESRGDIEMPVANASAVELSQGIMVEQAFHVNIQRLERISVQWGTYYRANTGTLSMELVRQYDGEVLARASYNVAEIIEGRTLTLFAENPIETVYDIPLVIRLYSDSAPGEAVTPLVDTKEVEKDGFSLRVNGELIPGILCFSAEGTDYIWTGIHYWEFSAALGALILLVFLVVWLRYRSGKHSYVANALIAIKKYRFLIQQLVNRDFKTKYKRSILGIFWSFLNPLLMMTVQYFVFSTLFRANIPNFAAYLIIGSVTFNFFSEACGMSLTSILGNAGLITKVYMPKYIYPLTRTMSSVVNLGISLIPMMIVCVFTGVHLRPSAVLALFFFACLIVFSLGIGMILAASMVFFRDTQFLWNILCMMWMYATPVFYPESILPDNFRIVLIINPLYHFLHSIRACILEGASPEPIVYFRCFLIALGTLLVGAAVFYKNQNRFVLYL